MDILRTGRTYFVKKDGEINIYYNTALTGHSGESKLYPVIFVYDYFSKKGYKIIQRTDIKEIITKDNYRYNQLLEDLLTYITNDKTLDSNVKDFIIKVWNENPKVDDIQVEHASYEEEMHAYLESLFTKDNDLATAAKLFNEVFYEELFVHPTCNEELVQRREAKLKTQA